MARQLSRRRYAIAADARRVKSPTDFRMLTQSAALPAFRLTHRSRGFRFGGVARTSLAKEPAMIPNASRHRGFALSELIVALVILALAVGTGLPAVQQARKVDAQKQCANHIKQLTLAFHNCCDTNGGKMPPLAG